MRERERSASRSASRQNSIQSSHQGREFARGTSLSRRPNNNNNNSNPPPSAGRSRASSYANSIVDVNTHARWGGYSPAAHIASPIGSLRSASIHRAASGSKSSRLGHIVEPLQEGRLLDSPFGPSSPSLYSQEHAISRQTSHSSFARRYDLIAGQIEEALATIPPSPPVEEQERARMDQHDPIERPHSADTFQEAELAFRDFDGVHYNPDTEEYVELDEEGHEIRRVSARTSAGTLGDMASMLRTPRQGRPLSSGRPMSSDRPMSSGRPMSMAFGAPPPGEDMVYYPAPVPRMLNMPKRLSQQPPPHVQAKRRSEMLQAMPRANRESAPWIPPLGIGEEEEEYDHTRNGRSDSHSTTMEESHPRGMLNQRMSTANRLNMPPQLRASLFFQQQSVPHDVQVQNGSAVATLDAILASSANAPVTAFTDHPYAGDVRSTVYAPEKPLHNRRSTSITLNQMKPESPNNDQKSRRKSSIGNFFKRASTNLDGETNERARPASRGSVLDFNDGGNKLRKRRSQMSMGQMGAGDDLDDAERAKPMSRQDLDDSSRRQSGLIGQAGNAEHTAEDETDRRPNSPHRLAYALDEGDQIDQDFRDQQEREDWDLEEPVFAQPSTLLAELQVRKAQLKSRNRTAATAFPNGMHSTLLQLDAVEAIEAQKRKKKKIALAWEDHQGNPDESEEDRDDVPLGMLFPSKSGNAHRKMGNEGDWDRPMGLMERREMEENEPLNHRRKRLNPNAPPLNRGQTTPRVHLAGQPDMPGEDEAEEGETLGQRRRRLALDGAITDVQQDGKRPVSTFSEDLLGQFGGLQVTNPDATVSDKSTVKEQAAPAPVEENETLGQRAARLRREREASGQAPANEGRPTLHTSSSMANLLSRNPVGSRQVSRESEAAQGTLLHASQQNQMKQKQDLIAGNLRASSYDLNQPLVDSRPRATADMSSGLIANEASRPANGLFVGAKPTGGVNTSFSTAAMNRPMSFGGLIGYFASPTAGMAFSGYGAAPSMMGYPTMPQYQQQAVNPSAYYALTGGYQPPQQQVFHSQPAMNPSIDNTAFTNPAQASSIERWRQNIAPA
ncbi:hypothetical protein CERZMDRAFT_38716 [Cercospora zeae-maydis SCOH1-5]|uniref:Uncharacterized protein n=1 Tax=Cercospora zeae-maydis SCOH1-5 TaxID=717836 RepID=A0A6A6FKI8_9PEZI|nr:hypothetical protein CERZMDRAFT_38716 [Cercospora zeae-maydis SCOH1-5]